MVIDDVKKYGKYIIYGAQVVAVGAYEAITSLTGLKPDFFAVGKSQGKSFYPEGNCEELYGVKVLPIEYVPKDMFIVVAVTELLQKEVLPFLEENGYKNVYPLNQHEEHMLMSQYYESINKFPLATEGTANVKEFTMYEVRNDRDKPLSFHPELHSYERTIQAGAALSEKSIADIKDNIGKNISEKNRMYCEMSAVYWVWKNTMHDWVGIEHYRRHLLVKPEMLTDDVDVIMPLPYICYPYEVAQFLRFTTEDVLKVLLTALKELHSDKYDVYYDILYGKYQYTYNMLCARREVFDDYCNWFFEITEFMEKRADSVCEIANTRALSYVAEVLTNIYFMSNQDKLKIKHVEKAIYI